MQHQIASLATEIEAARLLTYNAARLRDAKLPFVKEAAMAKLYSSEVRSSLACLAVYPLSALLVSRQSDKQMVRPFSREDSRVVRCRSSIDFMGGLGFSCEYPQEKFFRDCKVGE